jgi:AraC-like DNA-binding protein
MAVQVKSVIKGLKEYESLSKPGGFVSQSSLLNINGLKLAATTSTPVQYKTNHSDSIAMLIAFYGENTVSIEGSKFNIRAGATAGLYTGDELSGACTTRSLLVLNFDAAKLESTARGMLGITSETSSVFNLHQPREVSLQCGTLSFDTTFRQFANIVDQFASQPEMLTMMGVDDGFYSLMAMSLKPQLFLNMPNLSSGIKYEKKILDRTCQYIRANLAYPISLAMLDQVSSMSRRKLHYAFLRHYRCSPMEWVRTQRLAEVQNQLAHAQSEVTVSAVAMAYGFTKMSSFAQYYKIKYGELPSATLSRSLAR